MLFHGPGRIVFHELTVDSLRQQKDPVESHDREESRPPLAAPTAAMRFGAALLKEGTLNLSASLRTDMSVMADVDRGEQDLGCVLPRCLLAATSDSIARSLEFLSPAVGSLGSLARAVRAVEFVSPQDEPDLQDRLATHALVLDIQIIGDGFNPFVKLVPALLSR